MVYIYAYAHCHFDVGKEAPARMLECCFRLLYSDIKSTVLAYRMAPNIVYCSRQDLDYISQIAYIIPAM